MYKYNIFKNSLRDTHKCWNFSVHVSTTIAETNFLQCLKKKIYAQQEISLILISTMRNIDSSHLICVSIANNDTPNSIPRSWGSTVLSNQNSKLVPLFIFSWVMTYDIPLLTSFKKQVYFFTISSARTFYPVARKQLFVSGLKRLNTNHKGSTFVC